jgi:hypothetical protein
MQILKTNLAYSTPGGFRLPISSALWRNPHLFDYIPPTYHAAITAKTQTNPMDSYIATAIAANEGAVRAPVGLLPIENVIPITTSGRGLVGPGEGYGLLNSIALVQASAACRIKWIGDSTRTVTAITQGDPGQITISADAPASWVTGKRFAFRAITAGMTELSGASGKLTKINATTFTLGINTSAYTAFSGTAVIVDGDCMLMPHPLVDTIALHSFTCQGLLLDCNSFSIGGGIWAESCSNMSIKRVLVYAPAMAGIRTGTVDYALTSPFGAYGVQQSLLEQVFVSMLAGSGEYLISPAKGFWIGSNSSVNTGNTSLNLLNLCRAHTAKGTPLYYESSDDNFDVGFVGVAVRDTTIPAVEYASSAQDGVSLDGGAARYNGSMGRNGVTAPAAVSRNGVTPAHDNILLAMSRANNQALPTVEAGSSLWYVDTNGNTRQFTVGVKDGITAPTAIADLALQYVDTADGDLKERFGDATTKVISADT